MQWTAFNTSKIWLKDSHVEQLKLSKVTEGGTYQGKNCKNICPGVE